MINEVFIRTIEMSREEKGIFNLLYKSLLQLREEIISRVFLFLRSKTGKIGELMSSINSVIADKSSEMSSLLKEQLALVAKAESDFWKSMFGLPLKNYPNQLHYQEKLSYHLF